MTSKRDPETAKVLRKIRRRIARYKTMVGRDAEEYLDEVEKFAASWMLLLIDEIDRLEDVIREQKKRRN